MVHWGWLLLAGFGGVIGGFMVLALFVAGGAEHSYRMGYQEGHTEGFQDGIKQVAGIG